MRTRSTAEERPVRSLSSMLKFGELDQATTRPAAQFLEALEERALMSGAPLVWGPVPLVTPSALAAVVQSPHSVQLHWTDNDTAPLGYLILRATDGVHFGQIAQLTSAGVKSFIDGSVVSGKTYEYEVEAYATGRTSAASNMAVTTTPLATPTGLKATAQAASVQLQWTDNDSAATGYYVLRGTDATHLAQVAKLTGASIAAYTDSGVVASQAYYYQVQAFNTITSSGVSNEASATVPAKVSTVVFATRYGNELTITASGSSDTLSLTEQGSFLTILADGQTFIMAAPSAGIFIYTRSGTDTISIGSSVTVMTTIDTIEGGRAIVSSAGTNVSAWINSTDSYSGTGVVHRVGTFVGGVSKAVGASLANPKDSGTTTKINLSLWGTGPVAGDVNQGSVGDCYFLASLAAFAGVNPAALQQTAVDMGDGTYAVQYYQNGAAQYARVSNAFPAGYFTDGLAYAHPGANNTIWAMVLEKAFADFRTGANTYASISSGWMSEVYTDFGISSNSVMLSSYSQTSLYNTLLSELNNHKAVTFGTSSTSALVRGHAYTLVSITKDAQGVVHYLVRNPWGVSGDALENSSGYASLTYAQMEADFGWSCMAA